MIEFKDKEDLRRFILDNDFELDWPVRDLNYLLKESKILLRQTMAENQNLRRIMQNMQQENNKIKEQLEHQKLTNRNLTIKVNMLLERVKKKLNWKQRWSGRL